MNAGYSGWLDASATRWVKQRYLLRGAADYRKARRFSLAFARKKKARHKGRA
jgi:hypothetical protein